MIDISQNYYPGIMIMVILIFGIKLLKVITFGNETVPNRK